MHTIRILLGLIAISPYAAAAQSPVELDTLRVQAGSRVAAGTVALTRAVDVLDRAAIEMLPARNVSDVIARGLGVDLQARSPAQADVSIRGASFEQVLILIDGVAVNDLQTGHFHLDLAVPLDAIERIEIVRGPAASVYGSSAVGGAINIVTRRNVSELGMRVEGGSFGSYALGVDGARRAAGVDVRLSAEHDASDGHRAGTDHRITQVRAAAEAAAAGGMLSASGAFAARDFGAADFYAPFDSYEETRSAAASLGWRSRPGTVTVEPRLSYRQHRDDFVLRREDPAFYRNRHTTHQAAAEVVARWQPATAATFALGGEARRSTIDSNALGDRTEDAGAVFAEAAIGKVDGTLITAGIRADHHSTFGTFISPSASAGHRIARGLLVRGSAATGFRAPSWTDRFYADPANVGSPDLDAERFWTAELGSTWTRGRNRLDATAFVRVADDLIDWGRPAGSDPASDPWRTLNVEEATFRGLELSAATGLGPLSLNARASWIDFEADEQTGFESKYALHPLARSASLEARLPLTGRVDFAARAAAFRRADGTAWELVDARASARLGALHLFADVTNLLDERHLDVSSRPARGRALSAGLRLRR